MKYLIIFFSSILFVSTSAGQKKTEPVQKPTIKVSQTKKAERFCATSEVIEKNLQTNSQFRARWEEMQKQFSLSQQSNTSIVARSTTLSNPVTIPVVVHIVLPNPHIITDADIDHFINRLNEDFSGFNPDSTNGMPFYGVRGHSMIRFALAKRTPSGTLTNGIERRAGNVPITSTTYQAIKHADNGGLDPWNITSYYNLWVGIGANDLLGIAPTIGVGNATESISSTVGIDGSCVDYRAFASNSCYTSSSFDKARTAVHEIGHNFGLYHSFQDGCANGDFRQIIAPAPGLPASLLAPADDTPAQNGSTSGCPTGTQNTNCSSSPNPPGKMFQNYMDYTNDACYSMFTKGQVDRMHYIVETYRPGYLTTQGHIPPAGVLTLNVAASESVNPGGSEVVGCNAINYPSAIKCGGSFMPKFRFRNDGTTTITSISAGYILDNGAPVLGGPFAVNVITGHSAVLSLPNINPAPGNHTIKFFTYNPNGLADNSATNDTITVNFSVSVGTTIPLSESFSSTTFPPNDWTVYNPNSSSLTWERYANTGSGIPFSAPASAGINLFNYNANGHIDILWSPNLNWNSNIDSIIVNFQLAHRQYQNVSDTLELVYSTDCGTSWQRLGNYYKWSGGAGTNALATVIPACSDCDFEPTNTSNWRKERIAFAPNALPANSSALIIGWKVTNRYGNNIFIDDISIQPKYKRDILLASIAKPSNFNCEGTTTPSVTVQNNGTENITGFKVAYTIDNGTPLQVTVSGVNIAPFSTFTVALPPTTLTSGQHTIKAYTYDLLSASGNTDMATYNDTISKTISVAGSVNAPLVEGFQGNVFPPANWARVNNDNGITWQKASVGKGSTNSAFVNTYNYATNGEVDELYTPVVKYSGVDSVKLKFDISTIMYTHPPVAGVPIDTLEILATKDCGNTFTTVYKKWGEALQTVTDPSVSHTDEFFPGNDGHWRTDSVDLTAYVNDPSVMIVFRVINNYENNLFIDNVNISTKVLPALLKQKGFLTLPSPFQNSFVIWHYQQPTQLKYITVYNSAGQVVWTKRFNGNADSYITIDLAKKASGVYFVHLGYDSKEIVEKVMKY